MDKEKKMSNYKKRTSLAQFTDVRRKVAEIHRQKTRKSKAINDGLTQTKRKTQRIKKAANGCWWIEQYIMGSITYKKDLQGVDDE